MTGDVNNAPLPGLSEPDRAFRFSFVRFGLPVSLGGFLLGLLGVFVTLNDTTRALTAFWLLFVPLTLLFSVFHAWLIARQVQVRMNRDGIKGRDLWGVSRSLRWRDIVEVKPVKVMGSWYARILADGSSRPLCLPLCLHDMAQVRATVLEFAPPGSPLYEFFETYRT